jgi:RNA-binding protein YlmH
MINGDTILKYCSDDAERILLRSVIDKINLTIKKGVSTHTPFLNPEQVIKIEKLIESDGNQVEMRYHRLTADGEYTLVAFIPSGERSDGLSPLCVVKLTYPKQFAELGHRDVLGALMSLGLKRETVGDIRTLPGEVYMAVASEMGSYVVNNLTRIKHVGVTATEIQNSDVPEVSQQFVTLSVTLASLRLDVFVAAVTKLSREKSQGLISGQKVKLNYLICDDRAQGLKEGDLVSLRGYGRYQLYAVTGETKKNRLRVTIKHTTS